VTTDEILSAGYRRGCSGKMPDVYSEACRSRRLLYYAAYMRGRRIYLRSIEEDILTLEQRAAEIRHQLRRSTRP
jgi:hypothetical protein